MRSHRDYLARPVAQLTDRIIEALLMAIRSCKA